MIKKYFKMIVAVCAIFLIEICVEKIVMQMNVSAEIDKDKVMIARINSRIQGIAKQFGRLRMVIGSPCRGLGLDPQIESDLKAAGMEVIVRSLDPVANKVISRDLTECNIVIFGDQFLSSIQPDPSTGKLPKKINDQMKLLRSFLDVGGSIWFSGLGEQEWARSSHALNYILNELNLGAEVVGEGVIDRQPAYEFKRSLNIWAYAWTDLMPDPLMQGVENLMHPSGIISGEGSTGVIPIVKLSPEWRVLVKGRSTSSSFPVDYGYNAGRFLETPGIVKSSPILCAVRQAGKGRVVLWPTWSNFTVTGGSGGMVIDGEHQGQWSDGARLIENLLCWLAEPTQDNKAVGTFDPNTYRKTPKIYENIDIEARLQKWAQPGRRDYSSQFKGIIGAHSNLSDGRSSAEEMIAAAKNAGYNFIAFTEDFSKMDKVKWEQLVAVCDKVNNAMNEDILEADYAFMAYPGLDFLDEAGNRGVVFGHRYWIKDEWRSKQYTERIRWWYHLAYDVDSNFNNWMPRVIIRSQTNNKRPWNQGLWNFFGAYCYETGKLVDDSFHDWRRLIGRHAFFLNAGLMAVHTVRSSEEIFASSRSDLFQTYVRANDLPQVLSRLQSCSGPRTENLYRPGWYKYFPTYISSGPEIMDFRAFTAALGGNIAFETAVPGNDRGLLHIDVQSKAGLKEVTVYDGEQLVRRFYPEGKRFEIFLTIHPDSYHVYSMTVTDKQGAQAVSWTAFLQVDQNVPMRSGDNWNWMGSSRGPGTHTPPREKYEFHEVTSGWEPATWTEKMQPKKRKVYYCEQGTRALGALLSAAVNFYFGLPENSLVNGEPLNASSLPNTIQDFTTCGRYGLIVTTRYKDLYLINGKLEPATGCAFFGPYPVVPSFFSADLKQYLIFQKADGPQINRYEGKVRFVKNIIVPDKAVIRVPLGGATGNPEANIFEVMNPDGTSKRHEVGEGTVTGEIPVKGYICWYDDKGDGIGGIIALSPGVHYSYTKKHQTCWMEVSSPVENGTEVKWDVVFVTGTAETRNTNSQMEDIRLGLGIAEKPTLYKVKSKIGKVIDQKYFLTLEAEDYGFSGKIVKTTQKLLPIHLPVFIKGLNPRWDAGIWYKGKSWLQQFYPDWSPVVTYEPRKDEVQYIPVIEGDRGFCQIDTEKQNPDVFIGNLLVCNQPEVFITVIKAEKGKCVFEVNNPTDKKLECIVRPAKGFDLTGKWQKEIILDAGESDEFEVGIE